MSFNPSDPNSLAAQIGYLNARVARLENRRPTGDESVQPTYLSVKPNGQTGAQFNGGVTVPEGTSIGPPVSVISSLNFTDTAQTIREFVQAYTGPPSGFHVLQLASQPDATDIAEIQCQAKIAGGGGGSSVIASAEDSVTAILQALTIVNSVGQSSFLQTDATARLSTVGTGSLSWGGGATAQSATITPTGFTTLTGVITTCNRALPSGVGVVSGGVVRVGANGFQVFALGAGGTPANGDTSSFSWLAWGS